MSKKKEPKEKPLKIHGTFNDVLLASTKKTVSVKKVAKPKKSK